MKKFLPLAINISKYFIFLLVISALTLFAGKFVADTCGSDRFKYEYFLVALVNLMLGCTIFHIAISKEKLSKILATLLAWTSLYVLIITNSLPELSDRGQDYYEFTYVAISMCYSLVIAFTGLVLGSYYLENKIKYFLGFSFLMIIIYLINDRVEFGFFTDITLVPLTILLSIPAILKTKTAGESKYQLIHKLLLPYMGIIYSEWTLRPSSLTGSDYVIEPCAISIALLVLLYGQYIFVKYKKSQAWDFYKILLTLFLMIIIIRSILNILRAGWV